MAGGIAGWQRRARKENHRNVLQARTSLHNGAQILAEDLLAFGLGKDDEAIAAQRRFRGDI
jgi:hypothetical protein